MVRAANVIKWFCITYYNLWYNNIIALIMCTITHQIIPNNNTNNELKVEKYCVNAFFFVF